MTDYAMGGIIHGPREPGDDTTLAMLSPGCYFIPNLTPDQLAKYQGLLDAINQPPTGGGENGN